MIEWKDFFFYSLKPNNVKQRSLMVEVLPFLNEVQMYRIGLFIAIGS